jgi:hypothetical protein
VIVEFAGARLAAADRFWHRAGLRIMNTQKATP